MAHTGGMRLIVSTYIPGDSPVHRLDARVKVVLLAAATVALFLTRTWAGLGLAVLVTVVALAMSSLPLRRVLALAAPVYAIAAFSVAFNALSGADAAAAAQAAAHGASLAQAAASAGLPAPVADALGRVACALSPEAGLGRGLFFGLRIVLLAWGSLLVSLTSTSTELTDALRSFLAPLRPLRVPVDDVATALALAVRFIPLLADEFCQVRDAQWSRGSAWDGGLVARLKVWTAVMIPLFVGLFRRAGALAQAMDARCYGAPGPRTSLAARRLGARNLAALAAGLALCVAVGLG